MSASREQQPNSETQIPESKPVNRVDSILAGYATGNKDLVEGKGFKSTDPEPELDQSKIGEVPRETKDEIKEKVKKPDAAGGDNRPNPRHEKQKKADTTNAKPNAVVDEYGTEIKQIGGAGDKTYTQEELDAEVNRKIRERLARGKHEQPVTQPVATPNNASDGRDQHSGSDDPADWQKELTEFVDKRISSRDQQLQQEQQRAEEARAQSEYEQKFTNTMGRYDDFQKVVGAMPITNAIMIATRSMPDPVAFLYAASKLHPEEVKRIAALPDGNQQLVEVGRLEQRMKANKNVKQQIKPIDRHVSDAYDTLEPEKKEQSIDSKILADADKKLRRR